MKLIITGGAGFIGSAACRHFLKQPGTRVINLDKLTYAANLSSLSSISRNPRYTFVKADICDASTMHDLMFESSPDAVLHLAAESHVDRSINGSAAFVRTNIVGTHVLLEAARKYWMSLPPGRKKTFRFVHVSTDEVYGSLGASGLFSETTPYQPSSPYSASKAAADHLAGAWSRTYGLPVIITNCSNNYGPYHFPEKLIPLTILNGLEEKPLQVYGTGSNVRDWLYVEDHVKALQLILEKGQPGEKYNVGGGSERTNLEVVERICDTLDELVPAAASRRRLITFVPDRPGHDYRYAIDASKLERELGWRANESFESGLEKTVRWYLENRDWWQPLRQRVYQGERLGLIPAGAAGEPNPNALRP